MFNISNAVYNLFYVGNKLRMVKST